MPTFADTVTSVGIAAWGGSMPVLSPTWTDGAALPAVSDAAMTLTLGSGSWRAPLAGTVMVPGAGGMPLTLLGPNGVALASTGSLVLALHPQAYLRLARLYATVLEDAAGARPQRALGLAFRPVPRWIRYTAAGAHGGNVNPGDALGTAGPCSFHDAAGMPIDPLAVASAFTALMTAHHPLQRRALTAPFDGNHQVRRIAELAPLPAVVRVRLSDHAGRPHDGSRLQGLTAVVPAVGLFRLNASSGGGSDLTGKVTKAPVSGTAFTEAQRRLIVLGPATSGRLGQSVVPPKLPSGVTLRRDFLAIRVVELGTFLRGKPEPTWDGTKLHDQPEVRLNEPVTLLADGNDVLASAAAALAGTGNDPRLAVAQTIEAGFTAPTTPGADAHWPRFPATSGTAAATGPVPVGLRAGFAMTATFLQDAATANADVVVVLGGLPEEAHVRVYNRLFLADAREGRGDGAAGIVHGAKVTLRLRDPLRLRPPGPVVPVTIPTQARLALDVVVVKRTGETRIFGNVAATVGTPPAALAVPAVGGPNRFFTAPLRGVSHAGVLGLRPPPLPPGTTDLLAVILALTGEGQPRDASRLPTMAHRELIVAGKAGGNWRAVLSGGRLAAELHSADAQVGAPGGAGGRETQAVGLATGNGRLAWDLARAAHRRTTRVDVRIRELSPVTGSTPWSLPAEPATLAAGPPTATQGTMAAAALQTIAPACATPELALLRTANQINPNVPPPATLNAFLDQWLKPRIINVLPTGMPFRDALIDAIDKARAGPAANLMYDELKREVMTSAYGRRDAQWALRDAIGRARHSIYIETPGFAPTQRDYAAAGLPVPPYAVDLVTAIAARLNAAPGLHVTICVPREPDFGPGYEPAAAYEAKARRQAILGLPTANAVDGSRVLAFHPIGFPGRPSRLEATVVIVDDVWASVGACTLRRRGLTLDGSTDVVLTDMDLEDGVCPTLREFRRALLATRLGVSPTTPSAFGHMPDPTWVRLADGVEAFHAIRERLRAGGLGRIERLWTGETPGTPPMTPLAQALADPDGEEFNLAGALAITALAGLGAF